MFIIKICRKCKKYKIMRNDKLPTDNLNYAHFKKNNKLICECK